jgi:glycyl-tRNA synthetase beta chain
LKIPLKDRVKDLDRVTFFEKLGSLGDKARRIANLSIEVAGNVGLDRSVAHRASSAAVLAKTDLVTGMVYEFPELQGVMGRYYFLAQAGLSSLEGPSPHPKSTSSISASPEGEVDSRRRRSLASPSGEAGDAQASTGEGSAAETSQIADAIRDHYKPQGADDAVPTAPVSVAVALADKLDTLVGFWTIGEKPTGSKDPFALRRAALGVIRTALENELRLGLLNIIGKADSFYLEMPRGVQGAGPEEYGPEIVSFFHDRLKVYLRDSSSKHGGHRYDAIDAVLAKADGALEDDLVLIVRKLEALEAFLKTDDGANLAVAYKRAANILKAEEKKDVGRADPGLDPGDARQSADGGHRPSASARPTVDENLLEQSEEKALFAALKAAEERAKSAIVAEKFEDAMAALASLRAPIDKFFDKVTVNADDKNLRANRLALLARFRAATATVADLAKLEG